MKRVSFAPVPSQSPSSARRPWRASPKVENGADASAGLSGASPPRGAESDVAGHLVPKASVHGAPSDGRFIPVQTIPDIVVSPLEDFSEILERIRGNRSQQVILDSSEHQMLRQGGHVRRLMAAAAADLGKTLIFLPPETTTAGKPRQRFPVADQQHVGTFAGLGYRGEPAGMQLARSVSVRAALQPLRGLPEHARGFPAPGALRRSLQRSLRTGRHAVIAEFLGHTRTLFLFAFVAGALLTGVILFVLPRVNVTLHLRSEPFVSDVVFELTGGTAREDIPHAVAGRHSMFERVFEDEFPIETVVETGERAHGSIDLVNRTDAPQGIKTGTRLESEQRIIFRTERDAIIPARGRRAVPVRAEKGGTVGNLSSGRLSLPALPPESRKVLYGEASALLVGGADRPVKQLSEADIAKARDVLKTSAETKLRDQLREELEASEAWLDHPELRRIRLTDETTSIPSGAQGDTFRLRATIRAEALTADKKQLQSLVGAWVIAQAGSLSYESSSDARSTPLRTPSGAPEGHLLGSRSDPKGTQGGRTMLAKDISLDDLRIQDVRWEEQRASLSLHVETTLVPALDIAHIQSQLAGREARDAETFLRHLDGVREASVLLSPSWVKRVPKYARNVLVTLETDQGPVKGGTP